MKKLAMLILVLFMGAAVCGAEETSHSRFLMYAKSKSTENGWGIAGWTIAPNATSKPGKWYSIAGPRYERVGWSVEAMIGVMIENGNGQVMADIRYELNPKFWGIPLLIWGNEQLVDVTLRNWTVYNYLRVVYVLPNEMGMVGVESEDLNKMDKPDDYSVGLHAIIPIAGPFVLIPAYQRHFTPGQGDTGGQFWIRVLLKFSSLFDKEVVIRRC